MSFHALKASVILVLNNISLSGCITAYLFIYLMKDICFQVLAVVNQAARNVHVKIFVWIYIFSS